MYLCGKEKQYVRLAIHLLGDIAAVTVFQAIHILSEEFGIAAAATAEAVISKAVIAVIIGIAVGGGIDLLLRPHHANQDMYKLGKFAAETMVIHVPHSRNNQDALLVYFSNCICQKASA